MLAPLDHCLCCGNNELDLCLDLGSQPLANTYPEDDNTILPTFPLAANFCAKCSHMQLSHCVDRSALFTDYHYVSGTTHTLREDFYNFADMITSKHGIGTVLEIACNDGSQLNAFKDAGWKTIGIDPAENLHPISSKNHETYCAFLNDTHRKFKADVVVAQNVLAHVDNPLNFLEICKDISDHIYIQTSQADMLQNGEFDTIYHEHISFFSEKSLSELAERAGLVLVETSKRPTHGQSYLFHLQTAGSKQALTPGPTKQEVDKFAQNARNTIRAFKSELQSIRATGIKLIGYGAAAKGTTVLNAANEPLDYIVDDNPLKQNKYIPGMNIPIKHPDALLKESDDILVVPLSWNFYNEIKQKVMERKPTGVTLMQYFPSIRYESP